MVEDSFCSDMTITHYVHMSRLSEQKKACLHLQGPLGSRRMMCSATQNTMHKADRREGVCGGDGTLDCVQGHALVVMELWTVCRGTLWW